MLHNRYGMGKFVNWISRTTWRVPGGINGGFVVVRSRASCVKAAWQDTEVHGFVSWSRQHRIEARSTFFLVEST
ncbi:hypothetical protein V6N13_103763 [Hibiscus sabdariffa]